MISDKMIKKYVQEGKIYFPAIEFIAKVKLAFLFVFRDLGFKLAGEPY